MISYQKITIFLIMKNNYTKKIIFYKFRKFGNFQGLNLIFNFFLEVILFDNL